ncbi:helix-turn-helix domain-containing protein [Clostridium paraputrificum]|uniref:helix-turn-helix transcriptional regulator n=1 Tax=Clostridium paraputrificum TaxID=29363 RepID=UPI00232CBFB0|nr:helix-turn-helix domain-containing protein [Clostridium paraputrificum]MDB2076539.1 helix-turn-helix domain-containing protein [Clostridium paraputrificum]MDB2080080.1 helix-turn-helix domain-containing protein [Clostridium paraputrificum]
MLSALELERRKKGLTQSQLRDKAGVGLNTIVALEKGNIDGVRVKTLKKIAKVLDTTVQELFFNEEE